MDNCNTINTLKSFNGGTISDPLIIKGDNVSMLDVQTAAGVSVLTVDTVNEEVIVGSNLVVPQSATVGVEFGSGSGTKIISSNGSLIQFFIAGVQRAYVGGATFLISSTQTVVQRGTLGTCGIGFPSDPNTGVYSAGADQVGLVTNGSLAVGCDNSTVAIGRDLSVSGLIAASVTAGITASTTQTQGQGALTTQVNQVSVCANTNDTVTLPTAAAGQRCEVYNDGAQTLQIFPASGDNLGAGVDTATTLASGSVAVFVAYDSTNWKQII